MITCRYFGHYLQVPLRCAKTIGSFSGYITKKGFATVREQYKIYSFYTFLEPFKNPIMLDIGSSHGSYSYLTLLHPTLSIYSFEPYKPVYDDFVNILATNKMERIFPKNIALSNIETTCEMKRGYGKNLGMKQLDKKTFGNGTVKVQTLDSLFFDKIDAIKIDVEGHEIEVLEGAKETLLKTKPKYLQIESFKKENIEKILSMFSEDYDHYKFGPDLIFIRKEYMPYKINKFFTIEE